MSDIATFGVGDRLWFEEERMPYTIQASDERFLVCTKPFAPRKTVIYTIVDLAEGVRGPDDRLFGDGYESREDCERALRRLNYGEANDAIGISHRRRIPLNIRKHERAKP